ncbi:nucleoprotein/polynucleotide-associated enzyme [Luteimonas chenhongjianii]|uniref:Nucleoprotein/polynucleotide-associated enzyme n=1 Tax=Luteimonas chenhongjianii TaxID=2006110 RepID=A0A290XFW4_9GAMM|nr:DUF2058 domain-containing protein [Luteimonas chenhongjianii]ATD67826.1 nucleoprotein/polynucleotide-associated enzyme [Luteimonas chenhongjianii]
MRNPLQEQLLKAGLVKKGKLAEVAREQTRARHGKQPAKPTESQRDAERARQEKAERDRELAQSRNAEARQRELRVQARQLIADGQIAARGERAYRFEADGAIRTLLVDDAQARELGSGMLVIARLDAGHVLLPRALAQRVRERDPGSIVVDHGGSPAAPPGTDDYEDPRFAVPDDLVW